MSLPDMPDLDYECRYCGSTEVVPVLDRGIEQAPTAGNKYRRHCLSCWRWLPMCSASFFRAHDDPHVLPVDVEPERLNLVPLDDFRDGSATRAMDDQRAVAGMADDPAPGDRADPDDIEVDTSHISKYPPDTDIDDYIEDCNFRIERLGADGVWLCAYTRGDGPDHHFNVSCREDGLHIRHREEPDLAADSDDE